MLHDDDQLGEGLPEVPSSRSTFILHYLQLPESPQLSCLPKVE